MTHCLQLSKYDFIFLLAFICLGESTLNSNSFYAQNLTDFYPSFQHLSTEDGLPTNNVICVFKDKQGFLWVGTDAGAARFDGKEFIVFKNNTLDPNSLVNNVIQSITEDKEGNIWFATFEGASCYHPKENRFENFVHSDESTSLTNNHVGKIICDKNGNIWIGTVDGLNEFISSSRTFRRYYLEPWIPMNYACRMVYDNQSTIWMNGKTELVSFNIETKEVTKYNHDASGEFYGGRLINDLVLDGEHTLWVCTWGAGLRKFDLRQRKFTDTYKYDKKSPPVGETNIVLSMCMQVLPSGDTITWVGTGGSGIGIFNRRTDEYTFLKHDNKNPSSIASNGVGHLLNDQNGILWIATDVGLDRFDVQNQRIKKRLIDIQGLGFTALNFSIVLGNPTRNEIWLNGEYSGGIFRLDEMNDVLTFMKVSKENLPGANSIRDMILDSKKKLWVCTLNGLYVFDPEGNVFIRVDDQAFMLPSSDFSSIEEYSPGQFLLGVNHVGAVIYNESGNVFEILNFTDIETKNPPANVYAAISDEQSNIWLATRTGAYVRNLSNGTTKHFSTRSEPRYRIGDNIVTTLCANHDEGVFIGAENGLHYYDYTLDTTFFYSTGDGLGHEFIYDIFRGHDANFWIGTRNGLNKFDPGKKQFSTYYMSDGLLTNSVYSSINADDEGRILIGGLNGINWFYPEDLQPNPVMSPVIITSFRLKGKPFFWETQMDEDSVLSFIHNQNDFRFEFVSLNFTNPSDNQYAYRLIGYDEEWQYSGTDNSATYTNLSNGHYVFEAKGTNNDGVWSDQVARIKISIAPPFWKSNWFYAMCILFGIASIYSFIRYRTSVLRKQKVALERTVDERTHELKEQKELAELQRTRSEQSEKFKEQFLASMSHEIRTPMNAVMGMTNLLLDKNPGKDQFLYLDGIRKSSETLLHIIDDILDLSKIEAGKLEIEKVDFLLRDAVEQVTQILEFKAGQKQLTFSTELDERIPDVLIGDPVRLNQVLLNLGSNAIKFTQEGFVKLKIEKKNDRTQFSMSDTGIGIPVDKLNVIFDSFTQAQSSDTRKYGGTGLGLSISKQLVELMGGNIHVHSEPGKGSTFSFDIPIEEGSPEKTSLAGLNGMKIDGSILDGLRILIADDNEFNRIVAMDTLMSKANVTVHVATNGLQVLDHLRETEIDIILMDIQMPEMDGYEATRVIRSMDNHLKNIPIIALTASVVRNDLEKLRDAGMNDYVPKPFKASQLITAIAKATGRQLRFKSIVESDHENGNQDTPITDLSYLEKFCEGDQQRIKKYVNLFLSSAPDFITRIESALSLDNMPEIASQVHGFKTKWMMMGMDKTGNLASGIEQKCREESTDPKVKDDIIMLLAMVKKGVEELEQPVYPPSS